MANQAGNDRLPEIARTLMGMFNNGLLDHVVSHLNEDPDTEPAAIMAAGIRV
tara:strand:+ start:468 stop:623 length:156 start_codon:yes stop_codon:yes gene_type:complete